MTPRPALARLLAGAVAFVALAGASSASAATLTVTQTADTTSGTCTPGACSLRQATEAVGNGDTIVLPASATPYALTNGQLVVTKSVTIAGAGAAASVIQAQDADRVMLINGNPAATKLENLTVTGGQTTRAGGGGLAAAGPGPLVLNGVIVTGNSVTPATNGFQRGGGGVFSIPSLVLNHTTISDNTVTVAQSDGDGGGGGILVITGDLTITDSTVSGNTANVTPISGEGTDNNGGGGLYLDGRNLTITRSAIQNNTANVSTATPNLATPASGGGGIYQFGNNLRLEDSTVSGNVAHGPGIAKGGGGGVFDDGDTSQYLNSTITANSTDEAPATTSGLEDSDGGGGVLFDAVRGGVVMANMTITGNSASAAVGGGVNSVLDTTVDITNSIVAGNTDSTHPSDGGNCLGPMHSDGYNLTDDTVPNNSCSFTGTGDQVNTAPGLGALGDHGGPTPTQALGAGSPAIDAGDPAGCTDLLGSPLSTDQRGVGRPQPVGGRCDLGAYERALPTALTGGASVGPSAVQLGATVSNPDAQGGSVHFEYGPTSGYGSTTAAQTLPAGASGAGFSATVAGLAPGTYHFRVVAGNAAGTGAGTDGVFTVPAPGGSPPPGVTTLRATDVGPYSATLQGLVNPQGRPASVHFDYGRTTRYTASTPSRAIGEGTNPVLAGVVLRGLLPGRVYHFRMVAASSAGRTTGSDLTLRTARRPPPRAFTATVEPATDPTAPFGFTVAGHLTRPSGVSRSRACRGVVTVRATLGGGSVGLARTTVHPSCGYRARLLLGGSRLGRAARARIVARFAGTTALAPRSAPPVVVGFG